MEVNKEALNILLIYQGPNAEPYRTQISDHIGTKLHDKATTVSDGRDSYAQGIYEKCREYIMECDAAVAIVTSDPREASSCGNLWLEMGIWCGVKSEDSLLVLVHEDVKDLPTDVLGRSAPRFKDLDGAIAKLEPFVNDIRKRKDSAVRLKATPLSKAEKVEAVFCRNPAISNPFDKLFKCDDSGKECPRKQELYCFGSELLRMRSCLWEHYIVQHCFLMMVYYLKTIEDVRLQPRQSESLDNLDRHATNVVRLCGFLRDFSGKHLIRRRDKPGIKPITRLHQFLKYRIDVAIQWQDKQGKSFIFASPKSLLMKLAGFTKWIRDLLSNPEGFIEGVTKIDDATVANQLPDMIRFCTHMAMVLERLGRESYEECRDVIHEELDKINDVRRMIHAIDSINEKLPHNDLSRPSLRIWPREDREKEQDQFPYQE